MRRAIGLLVVMVVCLGSVTGVSAAEAQVTQGGFALALAQVLGFEVSGTDNALKVLRDLEVAPAAGWRPSSALDANTVEEIRGALVRGVTAKRLKKSQVDGSLEAAAASVGYVVAPPSAGVAAAGSGAEEADPPRIEWLRIPGGDFLQSRRRVLVQSFYMASTEVTVAQFRKFVESSGYRTDAEREGWAWRHSGGEMEMRQGASWRDPGFPQSDDHPVVNLSANDAREYCAWAGGRLPTEWEWRYAGLNGRQQTTYSWGDGAPSEKIRGGNLDDEAALKLFGHADGFRQTAPVKSFEPNLYGVYDVTGNVAEYVWGQRGPNADFEGAVPRRLVPVGDAAFIGGSWHDSPENIAASPIADSSTRYDFSGCRCVRESEEPVRDEGGTPRGPSVPFEASPFLP